MDERFQPSMQAALGGSIDDFTSLLERSPDLATARSSVSHPTLLQFVVLEGGSDRIPEPERFMRALVDGGADPEGPLVAAASIGSRRMASFLLSAGAPVESGAPWTPLEESVYWGHGEFSSWLLRELEARVPSLRAAAGLGEMEVLEGFLDGGRPTTAAGPVRFPWGTVSSDPRDVLDQALVIAAKNGQLPAVKRLLECGAAPDAFPPGVHERGAALHLAGLRGHTAVVRFLLEAGADPSLVDPGHHSSPAGWARHGGHPDLAAILSGAESA